MPISQCQRNGRRGFKACPTCRCHTYMPSSGARGRQRAHAAAERDARQAGYVCWPCCLGWLAIAALVGLFFMSC